MDPKTRDALRFILTAVHDTVREAGPLGAPAGPMYAALMSHGVTLEQFEALMYALVKTGKVTKSGDLYFAA